jgi:putative endopeptidase
MSYKNNFYNYVNQNWLDNTTIPDEHQRWGVFNELNENNLEKLKSIMDNMDSDYNFLKIKTLYEQFNNRSENLNLDIISDFLNEINNIKTKTELNIFIWEYFTKLGLSIPVNLFIYSDFNNANRNILHIGSGGMGLPDKEYYLSDDNKDIRQDYKDFMRNYLSLFGDYNVENIYFIEESLAQVSYSNVEKRDPKLMNNSMDISKIKLLYPDIKIDEMLNYINIIPQEINIINPNFLNKFNDMWKSIPLKNWIQYFSWIFLRKMGIYFSLQTEQLIFDFYSKRLSGVKKMKDMWKRSIGVVEDNIGMLLSKLFIKKYFNEEKKQKIELLIKYIKLELRDRLVENKWMSDDTKNIALKKLSNMNFKIGYPDKWINFDSMSINTIFTLVENIMNAKRFEFNFDLSQLYKEVDRTLWFMNPHEVNAYYSPSYNEIVFPAGILQEPFFGDNMIFNFGAIGMVIGHEITHAFDDQGRKYDDQGNLNDWWTEEDEVRFNKEASKMVKQFDELMIEGKSLNGKLTLGENIADLGGIIISFNAMLRYLKDNDIKEYNFEDFFYSYANIWKCKSRKEDTLRRVLTDHHSPPCYRVNQILSNFDSFYDIFKITTSDGMHISNNKRVRIW